MCQVRHIFFNHICLFSPSFANPANSANNLAKSANKLYANILNSTFVAS